MHGEAPHQQTTFGPKASTVLGLWNPACNLTHTQIWLVSVYSLLPTHFFLLPLTARTRYKTRSELCKCMFSLLGLASDKRDRCSLFGSSALPVKHMHVCTLHLRQQQTRPVTEGACTSHFPWNILNYFSFKSSGSQVLLISLFAFSGKPFCSIPHCTKTTFALSLQRRSSFFVQ